MSRLLFVIALSLLGIPSTVASSAELRKDALQYQAGINEQQLSRSGRGSWLGWGANIYNNRWAASDALVDASNVASLRPVCQKQYMGGESASPLVVSGIAYYPTWSGLLVALDYSKCKILWQTNVTRIVSHFSPNYYPWTTRPTAISRTTPALYKNVLFIGTQANALLLAINKRTGKLVDTIQVSDHPFGIVTQSPTVWRGRIFVGIASQEELAADVIPGYRCCSFIGTMNGYAFDNHFQLLWSRAMIPAGSNFSGAAIWGSQPSIDPKRNRVFIATGNVYSVPESYDICSNQTTEVNSTNPENATDPCAPKEVFQEAILAFDTATGDINWSHQLSPIDAWTVACLPPPGWPGGGVNPNACPANPGPDADFGMAPTFVPGSNSTPSGQDTLVVGQKNGNLYALSANDGKLFWATATSPGGTGLIWGLAVDATAVYYTATNSERTPWKLQAGRALSNGAFGGASLANGKILWETPVPRNSSSAVAPTVVNDAVMVGVGGPYEGGLSSSDAGSLLALNKYTGTIIVDTMLDTFFQGGIAVVHDYVLFGTGYASPRNGSFNVWQLSQ